MQWTGVLKLLLFMSYAHGSASQQMSCPGGGSALGMEDGRITDQQLSASSIYTADSTPQMARLNNTASGYRGAWVPRWDHSYANEYLMIDMLVPHIITGIAVQNGGANWINYWMKEFEIMYGNDNLSWRKYQRVEGEDMVFAGISSHARDDIMTYTLDRPFSARYIVVSATSWQNAPALRMELYGCHDPNPSSATYTLVQADIVTPSTWSPSQSPFVLNRPITVTANGQLTIQAGVDVILNSTSAGFFVQGCFRTEGLQGFEVRFMSSDKSSALGRRGNFWTGIKIQMQTCEVIDLSHTLIQGAEIGLNLLTSGAVLNMDHVFVRHCSSDGVRLASVNLTMNYSEASNCGVDGVKYNGNGNISVIGSRFTDNYNQGFYFYRTSGSTNRITFDKCYFRSTRNRLLYLYQMVSTVIQIENSTFISGYNSGLEISTSNDNNNGANISVTNSSFSGRSNTLYVKDRFRSPITPNTYVVAGNVFNGAVHLDWLNYRNPNQKLTFHNNTLNSSTNNPLYIYRVRGQANFTSNRFLNNGYRSLIILRDDAPPLTIRDNVFLQNSGPSVLEVSRITGDAFLGKIERNIFRNNSATVTLELSGKANATVNENTFDNFAANREVQIAKSWNRTQSMDMRYNYWGTADPHNISFRVDDFYINNRKAVAKLSPYLTTDNATKANGPFGTIERQYNSTESDGIGGVLIGDTSIAPVTLPNGTAVPINVKYTIYVPQGASLTIDPGVSLKFLENRGIVVDGVLNINGIASDMVKLTPVLYQSPWGGIVFTELTGPEPITTTTPTKTTSTTTHKTGWSTSTETPCEGYPEVPCGDNTDYAVRRKRMAEANSMGMSTLNYMNISRGSTCVEVLGGRGLVLLNSRLDSCTQAGISITTGSADQTIVIKNTTLMNMPSRKGMVIGANSDSGATILDVQGSKFLSNSFISISCSECHISFENSTFFGNTILLLLTQIYSSSRKDLEYRFVGNHFETTAWSTSHIMHINVERATDNSQVKFINNTVISNNRYNTIYFEKERYTDPFYNISGNYFTSPRGVSMRFYLEGLTNGSVKGNYFNNTAGAIQFQGSCCYSSPKLFEITENVFADTTNGGTLIDLNTYFVRNREVVVKENTFVNNTVSQYIITMRSIDANITGNFFDNPGSTYDLGVTFSYNENDAANAKNNWWGGPGFSHVIGRIFDYEDNPSRGRVEFQPYLNARNLSALSDLEPPFVIGPGRIGGTVKGEEILTAADSPYEVVRDILVPETSTLTIEPGASILFHPGIGMDVKGELMSTGAPDNPVKMTGLGGGSWKGITFEQYLPDPYLRAANGSGPHEGRLEVFFNNTWQLVCGTYGWDMRAAQVACRQLGYGEALEFFRTETVSRFTRGKLREYHMTSMNCNGDEHFLQECSIAVNIRYCSDSNLASVVCNQSATIPTNRSSLVHTVVSNTTRGVSVRGSPPVFKGIEITYSSQNGLTFSGYIPEETAVSDCIIANSGADGVSFTGVSDSRQNHGISIRNCTISNNAKRGSYIYRTDIALSNSSIHDNGEQGVYERRVLNTEIQNVDFVRNKQGAVYLTDTSDLGTLIVHDSSFKNNSGSVLYIEIPSNSRPNVSIARNVFTWNDGQPRGLSYYGTYGVIDLRFYFYTQNITGSYSIMKNSMENNLAEFVVRLWSNARDNYGVGEDISIIDNIFKNTSRRIYYREVNSVTLENVYNVSINRNVFSNPLATREFVAPKYKPTEYIDVSENCWDVSEAVDVYKRVLSIYEDTTRADVQLWPMFLNGTCGDVAPTQRPVRWGFSNIQDSGGEVDSLIDLGTVQGTVILGRSVVIRPKGVLSATIGSNLTLRFKAGRGLIIAGQMLLDNPRGSPVVFTSDSPTSSSSGRWNGIIFEPKDGQHSLSFVTISRATTCLTIRRANFTVGSVVVTDCSGVGISSALNDRASFVKIFNSTVNAARSQGIRMTGQGDLNLDNVLVKDTGSHAIEYSAAGDLIVTNSVVNKSSSYGIIRSSRNGGVQIMNSQITEIRRSGIQLSAYMDYINIEGNYIARTSSYYSNDWALALYSISYPVTVKNNTIESNTAAYDLRAFYTDDEILDARHNWWGSSDHNQVKSRIQDREVNANYGNVSYVPFLLSPEFSCNNVNNCSGNGVCIRPDTCECNIGRKGADCSQASCAQVFECQGRGTCVGPNTCQCDSGWMPPDCVRATCEGRNNCSNHGLCIEPNRCRCFTRYQGVNCSECSGNHWGPECRPCQPCVHGSCDQQTGSCVCSGPNWTGDQCNRCSPKFYGPACLSLMRVLSVAPDGGPDIGGTVVRVTGHNFPNSTEYSCRFGSVETPGTWISTEQVTCKAPKQNPNTVRIAIRSQNDGSFSTELVFFTYYGICPASACGRLYQPPRGICSFGECLCSKPWSGDNCTVLRLAPKIANIPNLVVTEGESVKIPLSLTEGSTPVEWRLLGSPSGMALDSGSQIIRWDSAVASPAPYTVGVSAQNDIGSDRRQFNLTVRRSYEAELDPVNYGPFISATPTLLTGRVNFIESSPFRNSPVPVKVVVVSQTSGSRRVLSATTFAHSNTFFVRFYPSSSEAGIYVAGASHPKDPQDYNQTRWSFLGMTVSPRYLRVGGYLGFYSYNESMKVTNHGGDRLHNVTVQIPEFVTGIVTLKPTGEGVCTSFPCSLKRVFQPGEEISLDLDFSVTQSASGYFEVAFVSGEQVYASGQVNYNFQPKMPTLTLTPSSIRTSISRGKTRLFEVNVTNSGLATAHNIYVDLGSVDILSVASFSKKGDPSTEDIKFHLDQGESATLVLSALIQQDASLGQTVGNILVRSDEVGSSINFRITTTSTRLVDIYVLVEDEYTYFGTNRSYLANATVHLRNKLENIRLTAKSNASGIAVFKDVAESFYDVYAEAEKHTPLSKVIAANEDQNLVRMFLERTGVTYNWRVEPVTFEDRYVITLEADFETQVPMPVVTIDPKELDLDVLERCAYGNSITFTVTNHGLIRADDFQFTLPDANAHPFLRFAMAQDGPIGGIPANTSVQFSVLVYGCGAQADEATGLVPVVVRQRRAFGGTVCSSGFSFTGSYSYICDTKRTRSFSVPARPRTARPACISIIINPPRGVGGPGGGPIGGCCAGSSSLTVTVTQDVSCEKCVLNVVDCILGNVPPFPFSCGYTIGTKARPGALGNGGAVGWAKDVADVVFACVPALSVLSSIWGGIRRLGFLHIAI
ncbi:uncharacterized protein LOC106176343 [Lingula anatina]|uniref:Uncharacterized protein LOC106176343 n=1 Tax=Lingula anatina TaxID=7574 RepID=A0A2R2MQD3_LINAN|nr:uncharacterized protein LOC106176343 [Lingula anatina]|eukprot:XP_023932459.1 uncharacterized protein LOC106176343 [Lingula anatina]